MRETQIRLLTWTVLAAVPLSLPVAHVQSDQRVGRRSVTDPKRSEHPGRRRPARRHGATGAKGFFNLAFSPQVPSLVGTKLSSNLNKNAGRL